MAGDQHCDGRRRPDQPLRALRRGRPRRRAREVRRTQSAGAAAGERGKPSVRALQACFAARDWDAMAEILADDISQRRSPSGGERRHPSRSRRRDRGHAGHRRPRGHERDVDRHCDPRGAPRPQSCPLLGRDQGPEAFHTEVSTSSRSTPTTGSRRASCSTSTTSTPPSRNSTPATSPAKQPPTRTRGQSSRGLSPHSIGTNSRDDAGLGRSSTTGRRQVRAR